MILVTGASGLLGANLVLEARGHGEEVVALSHRYPIRLQGVKTVQADLTDERLAGEVLSRFRPEWIVHCAALTDVDKCEEDPQTAMRVNVDMSRNLARAARKLGAAMVYISTDAVFDGKCGNYTEEDPPSPINIYAKSKLDGETAVRAELESALIIRTNIYGWNAQTKLSLAEWILSRLDAGQPVPGFRDVVFTPILVNDLIEVILKMMKHSLKGLYHVAGSENCSKYGFAQEIAGVFGYNNELIHSASVKDVALRAPRPENMTLKVDKICQALSVSLPDVETGIQHFMSLRDSGFAAELKQLVE